MRVLVTAGPTREYVDDVRFLSNPSTGEMGIAVASEAAARGHDVTLVIGPTHLKPEGGVKVVDVVSSREMTDAVLSELGAGCDLLVASAAPADYAPKEKVDGKIRSGSELTIELSPTRKLIKEARKAHPDLKIIAFKAEYGGSRKEQIGAAKGLLAHADLVYVNDVSKDIFGSGQTQGCIVGEEMVEVRRVDKAALAKRLLDAAGVT